MQLPLGVDELLQRGGAALHAQLIQASEVTQSGKPTSRRIRLRLISRIESEAAQQFELRRSCRCDSIRPALRSPCCRVCA